MGSKLLTEQKGAFQFVQIYELSKKILKKT